MNRYNNLPEILGTAIAQQLIENGAAEEVRASMLATLEKHREQKRKSRRERILVAIAIWWIGGSFGFWIGGKLPFAIAQSEGNRVTAPKESVTQPRLLRITLTLSDPKDLKVKEKDFLQKDAIISDRTDERTRLQTQRSEYLATIKRLSLEPSKPIEPLAVRKAPELPPQSFAEYESEVDFQRIKVEAAKNKVTLQQRKLDLMQTLDARDLPAGANEHEQEKLKQITAELAKEQALLQLQLGKFETAKANRSLKEYDAKEAEVRAALEQNKTQMEYQRAIAEYDRSEQERQFRIAEIRSKIADVENKLQELSTVRAQFPSEVKRIRYVKQVNNAIDVELFLSVADRNDRRIRANSQGSSATPFKQESFTKPN
jgi:hypothetical protein